MRLRSQDIDEKEMVKVVIEKPVDGGFQSAVCWLPDYKWADVKGFSEEDVQRYQSFLESVAHIIIDLSQHGGLEGDALFASHRVDDPESHNSPLWITNVSLKWKNVVIKNAGTLK